jgi:hypothetical protein
MWRVPVCPGCKHIFSPQKQNECPTCGFSFKKLNDRFGEEHIVFGRVTNLSGAIRHAQQQRLEHLLETLEKRIRPAILTVCFLNVGPQEYIQKPLWYFNNMRLNKADFGDRPQDEIDPKWMLTLFADVRMKRANFVWGYHLNAYVDESIASCLTAGSLQMHDNMIVDGINKIMKAAVRHVVGNARRQKWKTLKSAQEAYKTEQETKTQATPPWKSSITSSRERSEGRRD